MYNDFDKIDSPSGAQWFARDGTISVVVTLISVMVVQVEECEANWLLIYGNSTASYISITRYRAEPVRYGPQY